MAKRLRRKRHLTAEEAARYETIRNEFADRPTRQQVVESGDYAGPMSLDQYLTWRKSAGDVPLARQLQAALRSCGESVYAISKSSGVSAPIIQRFLSGERGITLETAGRLAAYLHLVLMPEFRKSDTS